MKQTELIFRPGDQVPIAGSYLVHHLPEHQIPHEVYFGRPDHYFPQCRLCDGVTFTPVRTMRAELETDRSSDAGNEGDESSIKLLLIEDNPDDVIIVERMFGKNGTPGFALTTVNRLSDALAILGKERFDILLLDLSLPDSLGLDSLEKLSALQPSILIIVHSGQEDEKGHALAKKMGAADYIVKGTKNANELGQAIREAIAQQRK